MAGRRQRFASGRRRPRAVDDLGLGAGVLDVGEVHIQIRCGGQGRRHSELCRHALRHRAARTGDPHRRNPFRLLWFNHHNARRCRAVIGRVRLVRHRVHARSVVVPPHGSWHRHRDRPLAPTRRRQRSHVDVPHLGVGRGDCRGPSIGRNAAPSPATLVRPALLTVADSMMVAPASGLALSTVGVPTCRSGASTCRSGCAASPTSTLTDARAVVRPVGLVRDRVYACPVEMGSGRRRREQLHLTIEVAFRG